MGSPSYATLEAVNLDIWRDRLIKRGILEVDSKGQVTGTSRSILSRIKRHGLETKTINIESNWIWLI